MAELPDLGTPYRYEPAAGDRSSGLTVVALHGAGENEHSLIEAARALAPGAAVLAPRGPFEEEGGFRHIPKRPPPEEEADLDPDLPTPWQAAVRERAEELVSFLASATATLERDPALVCLLGFSDGATAATAVAYVKPDAVGAAVILSGQPPFRPPGGRVLDRKQVFCATGRNDELVTMDDYEELVEGLVTAGADVELHWYDAGHEITAQELEDAARWLQKRVTVPEGS